MVTAGASPPTPDPAPLGQRGGPGAIDVEQIVSSAAADRRRRADAVRRRGLVPSLLVTAVWLIWVVAAGHIGRVATHWIAAVTMTFGSFVAGATPQGGGAVAFPVFTKGLEIPSEVARSFSLCIQTVGMGAAAVAMLLRGQRLAWRALAIAVPSAITGFVLSYLLLSDRSTPFSTSLLPGAYVKVGFTVLTTATAAATWWSYRSQLVEVRDAADRYSTRFLVVLVGLALLGGAASAQVGSGSDVLLFLGLVILAGLSPRVGVATSVVAMAVVSAFGFIWLGVVGGQLATQVEGDSVVSVGGTDVRDLAMDAARFDLFGLWLAAVPVVAWGAPLGALVTSRVTDRRLVAAVLALAAIEVVTTVLFVEELRTDPAVLAFGIVGVAVTLVTLVVLRHHRVRLLGVDAVDVDSVLTRTNVDVGPRLATDVLEETSDD